MLLGVGISSPVVTERWHGVEYGDRPLARVREYVHLVKQCLSGERVDFDGDFYAVKGFRLGVRLGERRPKVVVGALNPKMLAAGRRGGRRRAAQLPPGLARAVVGRAGPQAGGDATVYAYVHAGVCRREDGIDAARRDLFSYAVVDAYAANFERAGYGDAVAEVRERHAAGDREGALAAVSDDMVDGIDVMGDADTVRGTVEAYVDAGVEVPILMPLPWGPDRRQVIEDTMPRRRAHAGLSRADRPTYDRRRGARGEGRDRHRGGAGHRLRAGRAVRRRGGRRGDGRATSTRPTATPPPTGSATGRSTSPPT